MSDNPDETEYYLRLVSMYINLGTETVHDVFVYHSPGKDPYAFLKSKEETLIELKGKKILNKQQCELLLEEDTWTEQLPPPRKGWDNPPRNSDKSIAADLLRLRTIRNVLVGNLSRARLSQDRFEEEWKNVSEILLRIQKQITQGNGASVQVKIDAYRSQRLDPLLKSKYDEKIKGWYEDVSKMQDKVEDLVSKLEGFDAYFKSKSDRYERYIKLLVQGGTFVLSSFLDEQIKRRGRDLRSVLDENKGTLMQSITDPKHLDVLYPSQTNGQSGPLDISTWSVSILAAIILQLFDNDIGTPTKRAITQIGNAYSNYADNAFIALDSNTFEDYILDLRASLEIVSDNLSEDQAKQFDQILADSKKQLGEHDFQTYMDELKSQGIQMKSFTDIFKETLQQTQDCLKGMITQGISFKNSHDLELRMISLGSGEDLMMILEESKLAEIWHEALDRSIQNPEFADVKKVVDKIQDQIRKSKNLANIAVLDKDYCSDSESNIQTSIQHVLSNEAGQCSEEQCYKSHDDKLQEDKTENHSKTLEEGNDTGVKKLERRVRYTMKNTETKAGKTVGQVEENCDKLEMEVHATEDFNILNDDVEDEQEIATTAKQIEQTQEEDTYIKRKYLWKRTVHSIKEGVFPDQRSLNELCSVFGRKSKLLVYVCQKISEHIRMTDENILAAWPTYTVKDQTKITFVIIVEGNIRLEKAVKYSYKKRVVNEYSLEAKEVMINKKNVSIDQNDLQRLKTSINKNATELMKKHKLLSIISGSSVRSRNYGLDHINPVDSVVKELCIVLYVHTKHYIPIDEEPFEKLYDGVPVDVMEGEFVPYVLATQHHVNLKHSCQIGSSPDRPPNHNNRRVGSLGCFIDHPEYNLCGLTCAHVLLFPWALEEVEKDESGTLRWPRFKPHDLVYQPADSDNAVGQIVQVMYHKGGDQSCGMEVALFQIDRRQPISGDFPTMRNAADDAEMTFDSGKSCGFSHIGSDEAIKFGPVSDKTTGTFELEEPTCVKTISWSWDYQAFRITLNKQLCVKATDTNGQPIPFAEVGDSGSLVFKKEENGELVCVGIVEGGTSYGATIVTPIKPILQKLGVQSIKSFKNEKVVEKLNNIESRLGGLETKSNNIESRLEGLETKMNQIIEILSGGHGGKS